MENSTKTRFLSKPTANNENGGINCINCMSHDTNNLYQYKHTSIIRASDDFYPRRSYSHTVHLINVAYNSLFLREICLPDWDMFHSQHEVASLHAAARAIGGCPIYVSDEPGKHDAGLLKRLVLSDGSVLRASQSGVPTRDTLFSNVGQDGVSALKIFNWNSYENMSREEIIGSGVVGAFNVQGVMWNFERRENQIQDPAVPISWVEAVVRPKDIEMFRENDDRSKRSFIAYGCQSDKLHILESLESEIRLQLAHCEWEIYTIVPISKKYGVSWTPIGLANMLNPSGAITASGSITKLEPKNENEIENGEESKIKLMAELSSRGPGRFLSYSTLCPSRLTIGNVYGPSVENDFVYDPETGRLEFELPEESDGPHRIVIEWYGTAIQNRRNPFV